jgi:hypothetical protein
MQLTRYADPESRESDENEGNQQLAAGNSGQVWQNPQCSRNKSGFDFEDDTLP